MTLPFETRVAPAWEDKEMFGNLVESNSHQGDLRRKGSFFLGTLTVYALAFLAIGVGSIYAYNTHVENQDLRLVSMLTPVESSEAPTPPVRSAPRPSSNASNNHSEVPVFQSRPVITSTDPSLVPKGASVSRTTPELPEPMDYRIGNSNQNGNLFGGSGGNTGGNGLGGNGVSNKIEEIVRDTPPPVMKKEVTKPAETRVVSKGVINGQATFLPKPAYTAIAKAAHASGVVTVQVLIDETGKVISAHAVSGPPLLLQPSVQAALQARFTPTMLSNQPVKVSGIITYNFVMQ
jgi:hypothetical protein